MGQMIIHRNGAYNVYSTIVDAPLYVRAMDVDELTEQIRLEFGSTGIAELPERLKRAHATGCSSISGATLQDCITGNRAGPHESELDYDEFIQAYLTLPDDSHQPG